MIQTVYVLEILRSSGVIRGHFAQSLGAAQRAAGKYHLAGRWQPRAEGSVVSVLLSESGEYLARVVKEGLEYG
ncbi:hypothetical protein Q0M94_11125 [Deinococcus radiomollis]|uniref:hypothetical protein n=1 Tax=Deinococcus radiomollis TaxID=468916 RepID=UPI0038921864